uniref:Uncharacterized protein n=1 Tax=Poecilia mexicana TaxID=48701 RepID=A0A3B3YL42_9TELE
NKPSKYQRKHEKAAQICLAVGASSPGRHRRPAVCDDDDGGFLQTKIKKTSNRRENRNTFVVLQNRVLWFFCVSSCMTFIPPWSLR